MNVGLSTTWATATHDGEKDKKKLLSLKEIKPVVWRERK